MSAPNNIYGGGGRRSRVSSVDFYRRVPKDLTEVSVAGFRERRGLRDGRGGGGDAATTAAKFGRVEEPGRSVKC